MTSTLEFSMTYVDGPGTWHNPYVLTAMIICSIGLAGITICYVIRRTKKMTKPAVYMLILLYLFTPIVQGMMANIIATSLAPKDVSVGLHLGWGNPFEILVTILAAPFVAMIAGSSVWLILSFRKGRMTA